MFLTRDVIHSGRNLMAAKSRTLLTMLGVIIGVMSVVAVSSVGKSAQNLILEQAEAVGTNIIAVLPGNSGEGEMPPIAMGIVTATLTEGDYRAVRALPHVVLGSPLVMSLESVSLGSVAKVSSIYGTGEDFPEMLEMEVAEGRSIDAREVGAYSRVAVLGSDAARDLSPRGSPIGKFVRIKGYNYQVIGVMGEKGGGAIGMMDDAVFVPFTAAQKFIAGIEYLNAIRVKVDDARNIDWVKGEIEKAIRRRHRITDPVKDDFSVQTGEQAITMIVGITGSINAFLVLVTAISLLVGGINIMNIMYVAVRERTREIGLRKALGARSRRILFQFLTESSLISFSGGVIGLALGVLIALGVDFMALRYGLTWHFTVSLTSVAVSLGVSIGIGLTFGVAPAAAASRLDAIEALRYE
ncbi:ABC transporter permease [Candidatus Uhrbacteria bacterium]|nr:ABC transporter permease [Candidatus Uhrbacteria bacterium]